MVVQAHQQLTHEWWQRALPKFDLFISAPVIDEISRGDATMAEERLKVVQSIPILSGSQDIEILADAYHAALQLPERSRLDALHLAYASWHGIDYLLTWNCAHLASARVRRMLGDWNSANGIWTPVICTPEELLED
ncbi:MAG: type II toxin-antitoxin system VapC family toxin [Acidobacteriota bacterium]